MKKLMFILLTIISLTGFGQLPPSKDDTKIINPATKEYIIDKSYLKLRKEYQAYCDSIVTDTITETGVITYEAKQINGEIKFSIIDTVWYVQDCLEYKNYQWEGYSSEISFDTNGNLSLTYNTIDANFSYSKPTSAKQTMTITRQKYCKMKWLRGSAGSFYDWVDKNYLK